MSRCGIWLRSMSSALILSTSISFAMTPPVGPVGSDSTTGQLWQMLEYIAVDYHGAVSEGQIRSSTEYAEMQEFAKSVCDRIESLPSSKEKSSLQALGLQLQMAVGQRADPAAVARQSRLLSSRLIQSYPLLLAPTSVPDLKRGAALYQAQCASCHGQSGHGDGALASQMSPPPVAFSDRERASGRSLVALYQVISQGVARTAMPSFSALKVQDRWDLAFFVGTLSNTDAMRRQGQQAWETQSQFRAEIPNLAALARLTEKSFPDSSTSSTSADVLAYLRANPQQVIGNAPPTGVALVRLRLQQSLDALNAQDRPTASKLALSAYLDGFEPLEPTLNALDKDLLKRVETAMLAFRTVIQNGDAFEAQASVTEVMGLLDRVQATLGRTADSPMTTFIGAFTILLREGVEALLVVVGMIAFLKKTERNRELKHVHAGWIGALAAGAITWAAATYFVNVSGASRELTEGFSSLFAAVVLLTVGLWMHQKSAAGRWQAYLHTKLSAATTRRSSFALFALAFIAVYREVFETVLFYSAMWSEGNPGALVAGLGSGVAALLLTAWLLLRSSVKMPISKFFSLSSVLVAVLAVILAGKGIKALQEAGWLTANLLSLPRIDILGIYPSAETLIAQFVVLSVALLGFALNAQSAKRIAPRTIGA